jgi:hypothetical protein
VFVEDMGSNVRGVMENHFLFSTVRRGRERLERRRIGDWRDEAVPVTVDFIPWPNVGPTNRNRKDSALKLRIAALDLRDQDPECWYSDIGRIRVAAGGCRRSSMVAMESCATKTGEPIALRATKPLCVATVGNAKWPHLHLALPEAGAGDPAGSWTFE